MTVKIQMRIFFNAFNFKDYSQYFNPKESPRTLNHFDKNSFSILHLNIRSLQKNFDSLCNLLMTLKSDFKVICITEIWCSHNSVNHNLFKLPQYKRIHQVRKTGKGVGIAVFLYESRSSRPEVFCRKGVLRNCAKFTGKHLCQRLYFNKVAGACNFI